MKSTTVGGIRIALTDKSALLTVITDSIKNNDKLLLVSANSELIYQSANDQQLRSILNDALCFPESVGLKIVSRQIKKIIPGIELVESILDSNQRIYIYGSRPEVARTMNSKYPNIIGWCDGYRQRMNETQLLADIKRLHPDILLVALGSGRQEKWIAEHISQLPIKVAMGVGGSFDVLSGSKKRAPILFRRLGLEWLYRIVTGLRFKRAFRLLGFLKIALSERN